MSGHVDWAQLEAIHQAGILPEAIEALPTMNYLENKAQHLLTLGQERLIEETKEQK
jgi:hypothetical protein